MKVYYLILFNGRLQIYSLKIYLFEFKVIYRFLFLKLQESKLFVN